MKKNFGIIMFMTFSLLSLRTEAQSNLDGLLDQAISFTKGNDSKGLANTLTQISSGLEKEANNSISGTSKMKLLSQVTNLNSMISSVSNGKTALSTITKAISTIKVLLGANRISNLIKGGKSSVLSNASAITSNLEMLKNGASLLGGQDKLVGLISTATSKIEKLDSGMFKKMKANKSLKGLNNIINLASGI